MHLLTPLLTSTSRLLDNLLLLTNNLIPTLERKELLSLPPRILDTAIVARLLTANLLPGQVAIDALVDSPHGNDLTWSEGAANVAAFWDAAAFSYDAFGEAREVGFAGHAADVPYFEFGVPFGC